jgi:hypothetical protein
VGGCKTIPLRADWRPRVFKEVHEDGKVVSPTHRPPLPPGNIPDTHFCLRLSQPQGHSAAGGIMSMKNSNETIGNRFRDLAVCSAVPQPLRHRVPRCFFTVKQVLLQSVPCQTPITTALLRCLL